MNLQKFPSRAAWLKARTTLGASEAPIILGLMPWEAPLSLWVRRKNATALDETRPMRMGKAQERAVIKEYEIESGKAVKWTPNTLVERSVNGFTMHASPDALADVGTLLVEAKVSANWDAWAGDAPPLYVQAQVQAALWCLEMPLADVVAYVAGRDLKIFRVEADAVAQERIIAGMREFEESLRGDEPPWKLIDGSDNTRSALYQLWRERRQAEGTCARVEALDGDVAELTTIAAECKRLEAREKEIKNSITAAIARERVDAVQCGGFRWTLKTQARKEFTVAASEFVILSKTKEKK